MKHTAERLVPYAINGIVHVSDVTDPALRRLVRNSRLQPLVRKALAAIGDYDLLVPYSVDDAGLQLKRYIQYELGREINLTSLRKEHYRYYVRLKEHGSPADKLREWGFNVTYDTRLSEGEVRRLVKEKAQDGVIKSLGRNSKLYRALAYNAAKDNTSIGGYLKKMGIFYEGGRDDA